MSPETGFCVTPLGDAVLGPGKGEATGQLEWVLAANLARVLGVASSSTWSSQGSQLAFTEAPAWPRHKPDGWSGDLQAQLQGRSATAC